MAATFHIPDSLSETECTTALDRLRTIIVERNYGTLVCYVDNLLTPADFEKLSRAQQETLLNRLTQQFNHLLVTTKCVHDRYDRLIAAAERQHGGLDNFDDAESEQECAIVDEPVDAPVANEKPAPKGRKKAPAKTEGETPVKKPRKKATEAAAATAPAETSVPMAEEGPSTAKPKARRTKIVTKN